MKYTPDPEYRDEYVDLLKNLTDGMVTLLAVRVHVNRDGSRTDLNLIGVRDWGQVRPIDVTMWVAHALGESVYRTGVAPWGIRESSGGVNPVTVLQDRLQRALGQIILVEEA